MLNKLNQREKKLAFFAIILVSGLSLYFIMIGPLISQLKTLRDEIQKQSVVHAKHTKILNSKDNIEQAYDQYVGIIKVTGDAQEEISKFLQEIEGLSRKADVQIVDMKPLSTRDKDSIKKLHLEIEFEAQQVSLGKFLFELKNSQTMIHVDSLKINAGSRSEGLRCHLILSRLVI